VNKGLYAYQAHLRSRCGQNTAKQHPISFIRELLGVSVWNDTVSVNNCKNNAYSDVVFVAIDTEGGETSISEVGIAILDTRSLIGLSPGHKAGEWYKLIRTRHFSTRLKCYRFKFGITERVPLAALKPYIKSLISPLRNYVLVGHSVSVDLDKMFSILDYDLRSLPNVVCQLDTLHIVRGMPVPQKLSSLWKHLTRTVYRQEEERTFSFHNAGNDAVYNLQVLLMLATIPESEWVQPKPGASPMPTLGRYFPD
jgi:hypothetical protein